MKIMTILGTRPEIIRLSLVIKKLDRLASKHTVVHTGQNYDKSLSDVFFEQMRIRKPDYHIRLQAHTFGHQVGQMFTEVEKIIQSEQPDRLLVLGDTNSALCAMLGERLRVPVYHMEAGNRCYDTTVPEEMNRKMIDAVASFNLPYTDQSRENLLREGIAPNRIWVSGNPILEVMQHYQADIDKSEILSKLNVQPKQYLLVTTHRAENVDDPKRLQSIFEGLNRVAERYQLPVICSIHPRTRDRLQRLGTTNHHDLIRLCTPFSFFDFIKLQANARCVVTDSGTVQEESCILRVPAVTIRQSTERPETILCGSNILSGLQADHIASCVELMMQTSSTWSCPSGYEDPLVSTKVVNFLLGGLNYV